MHYIVGGGRLCPLPVAVRLRKPLSCGPWKKNCSNRTFASRRIVLASYLQMSLEMSLEMSLQMSLQMS